MQIKEFNNRKIADKHAEYITGEKLRKHVAGKVKRYVGDNLSVFDGAVGSGQLEQFIYPSYICGVEIQEKACEVFKENYPQSEIHCMSFFNFKSDEKYDCTIMNYPFSLKFKDLTDEEKKNIQELYPWKKSGVVDDIFILRGLDFTKRFAFYIGFPGITYRKSESKLREIIGSKLAELSIIENGFEDTPISVIFMVIDKEKTNSTVYKEIYDCKKDELLYFELEVDPDYMWNVPRIEPVREEIDIETLEREIEYEKQRRRELEDKLDEFIRVTFKI